LKHVLDQYILHRQLDSGIWRSIYRLENI